MAKRKAATKTSRKRTKRKTAAKTNRLRRKQIGGALARHKPRLVDKIAEGVAMGLSGPAPTFATAMVKLLGQAAKGVKDNVDHYRHEQKGGGINPILVDLKKGFYVTKDMINAVKKPIDEEKSKQTVEGYRRQYQDYKRRGGKKSYNSWILDKGYGARNSGCCIM